MEQFKAELCSKIRNFRNLATFSLKMENSRISEIGFLSIQVQSPHGKFPHHINNLKANYIRKSEFFEI